MNSKAGSITIVGGGIIGISSAWYLARAGLEVTVIDQALIGGACSGGNCGLICPSHVLPLTEPGALRTAIQAMLTREGPFRIAPRLDPKLWSWLWHFARRCNHRSMLEAASAIQALLRSGLSEYQRLVNEGIECEWQARGLLYVYRDHKAWDAYAETDRLLRDRFDTPAQRLDVEESLRLEPALKESIAGSWYYEEDAHLRPDLLLSSIRQRLEAQGVRFVEHCRFERLWGSGQCVQGVRTSQGEFSSEYYLFAGGAWMPELQSELGCKLPIQPGKGYSITMPRPAGSPEVPIIFPEHRVVVTPMLSRYRIGSMMEFAGYDRSIRPERLRLLRSAAEVYLREPYATPEWETWYGWRPMTYDTVPIIGRSPLWTNAWVATGHNMLGLSMGPATGRLVGELISGQTPHIDPSPYRVGRF